MIPARAKVVKELKDAAKGVDRSSTSRPTRTARARRSAGIWPRSSAASKRKIHRLMFNEITKKAILEAIKHPGEIDMKMVDAQQARRVLDRLVGYKISPILWDKVRRGLSAGRVQSVALKIICDREREIEAFVPEEYWHLTARLAGSDPPEFDARLAAQGRRGRSRCGTKPSPRPCSPISSGATFVVSSVAHEGTQEAPGSAVHHEQAAAGRRASRSRRR